jgi:hypothetical protein
MIIMKRKSTQVNENRRIATEIPVLTKRLPHLDKAYVYTFCDLHIGEPKVFDEKKFRGYMKIIETVPEAYCMFDGDLINCGLPGGVGGEEFWDQDPLTADEQHQKLMNIVTDYDIQDKIIAVVGGSNHPGRAKKAIGHNYDKQFARELGIEDRYVEPLGVIFLGVGTRSANTKTHHKGTSNWYTIVVTHGWAGGRQAGSSINAIRELGAIYGADCIVTAHRHLDAVTKDEFYLPDYHSKSITKIKRMFVNAGTFMDTANYALKKGLRPNGTGTPRIRFEGAGKKDIHVSI